MIKKSGLILSLFLFSILNFNAFGQSDEEGPYVFCYSIISTKVKTGPATVKGAWAIAPDNPELSTKKDTNAFCGGKNCKYFRLKGFWGNSRPILGTVGSSGWMNYFRLNKEQKLDDVKEACRNAFKHPEAQETQSSFWWWKTNTYDLNNSDPLHLFRGNYKQYPYNFVETNEVATRDSKAFIKQDAEEGENDSLVIYPVAIPDSVANNLSGFQYPIIEADKKLYYLDYKGEGAGPSLGKNGIVDDTKTITDGISKENNGTIEINRSPNDTNDKPSLTGNFLNYRIIYDYAMVSNMAYDVLNFENLGLKDFLYTQSNEDLKTKLQVKSKLDIPQLKKLDESLNKLDLKSQPDPTLILSNLFSFEQPYNHKDFCGINESSSLTPNAVTPWTPCDNPDGFKTLGIMLPSTSVPEGNNKYWPGVYVSEEKYDGGYGIAVVSERLHRIIIGFKGTKSADDVLSDLQTITGLKFTGNLLATYISNAYHFYRYIQDTFMKKDSAYEKYEIVFTGHSLGGFIAAYAALKTNNLARTFSSVSTYLIYEYFQIPNIFSPFKWLATTTRSTGYLPLPNVINFARTLDPVISGSQLLWRNTPINTTVGFPAKSNLNPIQMHGLKYLFPDIIYPYMSQFNANIDQFPVPGDSVHLDLSNGLKALASIISTKTINPRPISAENPGTLSYLYFYPDTILAGNCDVVMNPEPKKECNWENNIYDEKDKNKFSLNFVGYFNGMIPYYNTFNLL